MGINDFVGIKYKLEKSENFEEYLEAVGVSQNSRKLASSATPVIELTEAGGEYTLTYTTAVKTIVIKFRLGEEFDEELSDGIKVRSRITLEGSNRLVHVMRRGDKVSQVVREFSKQQILMTLTADNIVSNRVYKAL